MNAKLILQDGSTFEGTAFGAEKAIAGEVVFNTGMVGYPECFTDPSYAGQILVLTYPLIGNYGVPEFTNGLDLMSSTFESSKIHIAGLIVADYSTEYSHREGHSSLSDWLKISGVPAITGIDTRFITQKLRERGSALGKIVIDNNDVELHDPNLDNLVDKVAVSEPQEYGSGKKKILLFDCGCKYNIVRSLVNRGVVVKTVPWNWDLKKETYDGIFVSNGPGNPKMCQDTIQSIRDLLDEGVPTFGLCLGNQLLALAAGADTYKLKFGHRSQNQPCIQVGSKRCFITSQNHGYAVDETSLPDGWEPWFFNANDGTNEGIRHGTKPFMSVQFHPEATPGPVDTAFLFDEFINLL